MKQKVLQNKYCRWGCIEPQPYKAETLVQAVHARCRFPMLEGLHCLKAREAGFLVKEL
jgi:hypothetical protein